MEQGIIHSPRTLEMLEVLNNLKIQGEMAFGCYIYFCDSDIPGNTTFYFGDSKKSIEKRINV